MSNQNLDASLEYLAGLKCTVEQGAVTNNDAYARNAPSGMTSKDLMVLLDETITEEKINLDIGTLSLV